MLPAVTCLASVEIILETEVHIHQHHLRGANKVPVESNPYRSPVDQHPLLFPGHKVGELDAWSIPFPPPPPVARCPGAHSWPSFPGIMLPVAYGMAAVGGTGFVVAPVLLASFGLISAYTMISVGRASQRTKRWSFSGL